MGTKLLTWHGYELSAVSNAWFHLNASPRSVTTQWNILIVNATFAEGQDGQLY